MHDRAPSCTVVHRRAPWQTSRYRNRAPCVFLYLESFFWSSNTKKRTRHDFYSTYQSTGHDEARRGTTRHDRAPWPRKYSKILDFSAFFDHFCSKPVQTACLLISIAPPTLRNARQVLIFAPNRSKPRACLSQLLRDISELMKKRSKRRKFRVFSRPQGTIVPCRALSCSVVLCRALWETSRYRNPALCVFFLSLESFFLEFKYKKTHRARFL